MDEIVIRPYRKEDRPAIRRIACDTAFMGEPAEIFFDDREVLADLLTGYFTDCEPESSFVAETGQGISGYIIGAKDAAVMERVFISRFLPKIASRVLLGREFLNRKNAGFVLRLLFSLIKGELRAPDFSREYPAVLHINLVKGSRGQGIGSRLIGRYLAYLEGCGLSGVHLATISAQAPVFFEQQGFTLLHKNSRSYFRKILHQDIECRIYGKKLTKK